MLWKTDATIFFFKLSTPYCTHDGLMMAGKFRSTPGREKGIGFSLNLQGLFDHNERFLILLIIENDKIF